MNSSVWRRRLISFCYNISIRGSITVLSHCRRARSLCAWCHLSQRVCVSPWTIWKWWVIVKNNEVKFNWAKIKIFGGENWSVMKSRSKRWQVAHSPSTIPVQLFRNTSVPNKDIYQISPEIERNNHWRQLWGGKCVFHAHTSSASLSLHSQEFKQNLQTSVFINNL